MVHHFFFVHKWQYSRAFQTCKRGWKSFHRIIHMIIQFQWSTHFKWFLGWAVALKTQHFMLQSHVTWRKDQNDYRMMAETNLTKDEAQTNAFKDLRCSPSLAGGLQPQSIYFSAAVYILLSITKFLGNSLILVALQKESSLHPPSKLLYRCLVTTDLLVGIFSQPMMSLANDNWRLCRYASHATFTTSYTSCLTYYGR